MLKKFSSLALALFLTFGMCTATASSANLIARPTASTVLVNGKNVAFDAYNINDNNYFKLRDLANTLSGTARQFEVGWDGVNNAISLISGKPYVAAGDEMASKGADNKTPAPTTSKIYIDGKEMHFTAYNIDGNNYFKLRDIGEAFNFGVDWDGTKNTIVINTEKRYATEDDTAIPPNDNEPIPEIKIIKLGTGEAGITLPKGWEIANDKGTFIPGTEETYDLIITPPSGEKALGIVTVGKNNSGETLTEEEFLKLVSARVAQIIPDAVEDKVEYKKVTVNDGNGLYCVLTDASLVGETPAPDEYLYVAIFFVNHNNGCITYASLLTDDTNSDSFKIMLNAVADMKVLLK